MSETRRPGGHRLAVLPCVLIAACLAARREAAAPPATAILVRAAPAALAEDGPALTLTGEIRAQLQSDLSFRVGGRMAARHVDVGAHVTAGQLVAELDPGEQQASVAAAQAS